MVSVTPFGLRMGSGRWEVPFSQAPSEMGSISEQSRWGHVGYFSKQGLFHQC